MTHEEKLQKFNVSYSGRKVMREYAGKAGKYVWCVKGEDQPVLGYFRGTFKAVVDVAIELPGFWSWGAGGDIEKVEIVDV